MFELKPIHRDAIPAALEKAERYRLLNQPRPAESICLDVLRVDPENQQALITLLLVRTDQFGRNEVEIGAARAVLPEIKGDYEAAYYEGMICERWGKAQLARKAPPRVAAAWLRQAMDHFERAAPLGPPGNDAALLRWNACARLLMQMEARESTPDDEPPGPGLLDDTPVLD